MILEGVFCGRAQFPVAELPAVARILAFAGSTVILYNDCDEAQEYQNLSYSVFYEHAAEGGYVAFVPALPGRHTQGETIEAAEENVREAIALYLESLSAHGE